MALASYDDLLASVASWLNRADLTDQIPDFVTLAEAQFSRRITHPLTVARSDAAIAAGDEYLTIPDDFIEIIDFVLETDPITPLKYTSPESLTALKATDKITGAPAYYTVVGQQIQIFPVADAAYTAEMTYRRRVVSLSPLIQTNWVMDQYPDIYLYGALVQSAPYLREDSRATVWGELFVQAITDCNNAWPAPPEERTLESDAACAINRNTWNINTGSWN